MTQQKNESLSAFVDGELLDNTMISGVMQDSELSQKWQRYHLVRDVMRKELPAEMDFDIAANVAKALELEPTILAPKNSWRDLPVVAQVIPLVRNAGQFAVAASVAAAVIFGVQQFNQPLEVDTPNSSVLPLSNFGVQGGLSPVSLQQSRALPAENAIDQRRRVVSFLTDHQQQMRLKHNPLAPVVEEVVEETQVEALPETDKK
ncbi:RseA family anti-sigma factor [Alteromonadaceae bacterium BrNp21-10]|nr:RseA family anti-sigma factor [Alteromonadaceae bacterium BrNp21-10]